MGFSVKDDWVGKLLLELPDEYGPMIMKLL